MTFSDQMASDLSRIIAVDDNGDSATYKDPSGQDTALTVVLYPETTETQETNGIRTKLRRRDCTWAAATLSNINRRATIKIGSDEWAIAELLHSDDQQVAVRIERHELMEHTRPEYRRR